MIIWWYDYYRSKGLSGDNQMDFVVEIGLFYVNIKLDHNLTTILVFNWFELLK